MDDSQRQRLADNEVVFRDVNERIDQRAERWKQLDQTFQWAVCECSNTDCMERIAVTPSEYRMARRDGARFLVARRHDNPEIERVVFQSDRFWIVEKHADLLTT